MTQPCFAAFVTANGSEDSPLSNTLAIIPSWNDCIALTNLSGHPNFRNTIHKASRFTESVAYRGENYSKARKNLLTSNKRREILLKDLQR